MYVTEWVQLHIKYELFIVNVRSPGRYMTNAMFIILYRHNTHVNN